MGKTVEIELRPGSIFTDVTDTEGQLAHYEEIINLRLNKIGEWESVRGYQNVVSSGVTNLVSGTEVEEDRTGERFLLLQDGTSIVRIDYDSSNGYAGQPITPLTLPTGVTISASTALKFFYFRGVVRITGASEPLWYGYVNRTLFTPGANSFTITKWVLEKAAIEQSDAANGVELTELIGIYDNDNDNPHDKISYFVKYFYIFDSGQIELLKKVDNQVTGASKVYSEPHEVNVAGRAISARITVKGNNLQGNMFNERITGVGIAFAIRETGDVIDSLDGTPNQAYNDETEPFYVTHILPFDTALDPISTVIPLGLYQPGTDLFTLQAGPQTSGGPGFLSYAIGYLGNGVDVELTYNGSQLTASVVNVTFGDASNLVNITFNTDLSPLFGSSTIQPQNVGLKINRKWHYGSGVGYFTYFGVNSPSLGTEFSELSNIPQGTTSIVPKNGFKYHTVIENIAYIAGLSGDESDTVRYSPVFQFDVFPAQNIIQTEVADNDAIKAIEKFDNKLAIMKGKSISQGNFIGGSYTENIGIVKKGLFPDEYGFLALNDVIFIMDRDDIHVFNGINVVSLFKNKFLRDFYVSNVTNTSFMAYRKQLDEVFFFVGSKILVWQRDMQEESFYLRSTDVTPLFAFTDADNRMLLASTTKIFTFDHASSTFDESITWSIKTKLYRIFTGRFFKKLREVFSDLKSTQGVNIQMTEIESGTSRTIAPPTPLTNFESRKTKANFLFRTLRIDISSAAPATNLLSGIRKFVLRVEAWRR